MAYYKTDAGAGHMMRDGIDRNAYDKLSDAAKKDYTEIREAINHPNISGPFETGWGYTDFDVFHIWDKIGVPNLPGQITTVRE